MTKNPKQLFYNSVLKLFLSKDCRQYLGKKFFSAAELNFITEHLFGEVVSNVQDAVNVLNAERLADHLDRLKEEAIGSKLEDIVAFLVANEDVSVIGDADAGRFQERHFIGGVVRTNKRHVDGLTSKLEINWD